MPSHENELIKYINGDGSVAVPESTETIRGYIPCSGCTHTPSRETFSRPSDRFPLMKSGIWLILWDFADVSPEHGSRQCDGQHYGMYCPGCVTRVRQMVENQNKAIAAGTMPPDRPRYKCVHGTPMKIVRVANIKSGELWVADW